MIPTDSIPAESGGAVIAPPRRWRSQGQARHSATGVGNSASTYPDGLQVPSQPWQAVGEMVEIKGYTDLEIIGRGGFAVVYKARQVSVGRDVAIKLLTDPAPDDDLVRRFTRESKAVGALSWHPHIAAVVDAGSTAAGQAFIVFEFLTGGSLDELIAARPMPWHDAVEAMIQVADAVEAAHRSGVLHRDIKPANILLDRLGVAKLGDFGIASMQDGHKTESGVLAATIAHAAPELFDGQIAGRATDVYALGSTLHTLLVGTSPFQPRSQEMMTVISRILHDPPPVIDTQQVPEQVSTVVAHALAKQAAYRPRSAAAFGRALQQAQHALGVPVTTMPVSDDQSAPADYSAIDVPPAPAAASLPTPTTPATPATSATQPAPLTSPAPSQASAEPTAHVAFVPHVAETSPASEAKPFGRTIVALAAVAVLLAAAVAALLFTDGSGRQLRATTDGGARISSGVAFASTEMAAPFDGSAALDQDVSTYWGIEAVDSFTGVDNTSYNITLTDEQTISRVGISNGTDTDWGRVTEIIWSTGITDGGQQTGSQITQPIPDEPGAHTVSFDVTTDQLVLVLSGTHDGGSSVGIAEILIEVIEGTS